jgi:hypothetical protein
VATTALTLITQSLGTLNVFQAGEPISPDIAQDCLTRLNGMMGQWALDGLTIPAESREVFPLVANKGTLANPYTIGVGGNFNTARPVSQVAITGIGLLYPSTAPLTTPPVEVRRTLYTDQAWQAVATKDQPGAEFSGAHYSPTYVGGLGTFQLWPVPDNALNSFVLYRKQPLGQFVTLSASYDLPLGYDDAISDNLAIRLATPYGRPLTPELRDAATTSLNLIKRANVTMSDLGIDPMYGGNPGGYDIYRGA